MMSVAVFDWVAHTIIGILGAGTGYGVRTFCKHKGLLPHPVGHISLTVLLVGVESFFTVSLLG